MAIKNFLFSLVALSLLTSCAGIERRHAQTEPLPVKVEPGQAQPVQQVSPVGNTAPGAESGVPQTLPTETVPAPGQALPVGIYLGPGAIRSFAHIGVLRALQRAQIPIVAVGGMEWGSIIAASFALSRGANEVEWEMMKLHKSQLPSSSLLHHEVVATDPAPLYDFLRTIFGEKDLASGSVPFTCSTTDGNETVFVSKGKASDQLLRCSVLPPLYTFYDRAGKQWVSGAVSPGDWPGELRKMGAQFIIYVDVTSRGNLLSPGKYANGPALTALWYSLRSMSKQQHLFANLTIEVPSEIDLTDFDRRREAIAIGERAAQNYVPTILNAIGVR
jgi:NTE family protein